MKKLVLINFTIILMSLTSLASDIISVRKMFYAAAANSAKTNDFLKYVEKYNSANSTIKGYRGMAYMLLAKNAYNPVSKLNNFLKGRDMLESAIKSDPGNIELRFLRLSVQQNAPFFLNYSANIQQDKAYIVANYAKLADADLKHRIKNFMEGK